MFKTNQGRECYIIFIFSVLFLLDISPVASQTTLDFETWDTGKVANPTGWATSNFTVDLGTEVSVVRATDSHKGTYAMRMKTTKFKNQLPGLPLNYPGLAFTGKLDISKSLYLPGFPYTKRPVNFNFWFKYFPVADDTAGVVAWLTHYNSTLKKRDTIGITYYAIMDYTPDYTLISVPFYYSTITDDPDTLSIQIAGSTFYAQDSGAVLYIDDIELKTAPSGISSAIALGERPLQVFPNPTQDVLNIKNGSGVIQIISPQGLVLISSTSVIGAVDVSHLAQGLYFVRDESGRVALFRRE
jgi:hypothetical protein